MEKVGIIGMGISGMGVLEAYRKENLIDQVEITCFDSKESFGRGYPFRKDSDEVLLNITSDRVSYDYENPEAFKDWLIEKGIHSDYVPRHLFGTYTEECIKFSLKESKAKKVTDKVENIKYIEDNNQWKIITNKDEYIFDRIHLCCGELPQLDPYDLNEYKNYINPIYPAEECCSVITENDSVCIIGTSLSAIDISRYLLIERNVKDLYIFSRSNTLPTIRGEFQERKLETVSPKDIKTIIENNDGHISFEEFDNLFETELNYHGLDFKKLCKKYIGGIKAITRSYNEPEDIIKIQGLFANLGDLFNIAWLGFWDSDREKFSEKYEDFLQVFGGPIPMTTGEIILKAKEKNHFKVLDDIIDIKYSEKEKKFLIIQEEGEDEKSVRLKVDYVCNATGLDTSLRSVKTNSFIGQLLDKRYAQIDNYGGITVLPKLLNVVSPKFGIFDNLHAHGVMIVGVQLRNNSINVIQKSAHRLIKEMYKKQV